MKRLPFFALLLLALFITACSGGTPIAPVSPSQAEESPYPNPVNMVPVESIPWYPAPGLPGAPVPGMVMTSGFEPQPEDANLNRGETYLDLASSQLIIMESYPIQVTAILNGNLPDPCHQLRVAVTAADANNRINLEVYSLADSTANCATVLEPFTANIPLGAYSGGHFSVYVNRELLGEFDS
jgi:hypothetical protein